VNFSQSKLIVLLSYKPDAFEERFGSINIKLFNLLVFVESYDGSFLGGRTE